MQKEMMAMATENILATLADLVNDPENNEQNGDWRENAKEPDDKGMTGTYNGYERDGKTVAFGGYSNGFVINEDYALQIPSNLEMAEVAPLLCAGITLYSPIRYFNTGPDKQVGVMGLGGLGHMGVKFAAALGAEVTVLSHSESKREDALRMGAKEFIVIKIS